MIGIQFKKATRNRLRIGKAESLDERPEAKSGKETKQKPSSTDDASDEPLIIEAEVEGYLVRRVYVDEGSSVEVMFEHCFENLPEKVRAGLRETRTDLGGFRTGDDKGRNPKKRGVELLADDCQPSFPDSKWSPFEGGLSKGYAVRSKERRGHLSKTGRLDLPKPDRKKPSEAYWMICLKGPLTSSTHSKNITKEKQARVPIGPRADGGFSADDRGLIMSLSSGHQLSGRDVYVSRTLNEAERNYSPLEKLALSLVNMTRRLRRYFEAHPWRIELPNLLNYGNASKKVKVLARFPFGRPRWKKGRGGGVNIFGVRRSLGDSRTEAWTPTLMGQPVQKLQESRTNNEAEYEALLAGLRIARMMNVLWIEVKVDSKLVASQINGAYEASNGSMIKYLAMLGSTSTEFKTFSIENIPRGNNQKADVLSKLATVPFHNLTKEILVEANYVIREIHNGSCGMHVGPRAVVRKAMRQGYYWPTMHADAKIFRGVSVDSCQIPLHRGGMDILGPLPPARGGAKFVIVAIDYFTKWVEAKPLVKITGKEIIRFVLETSLCRYGSPRIIVKEQGGTTAIRCSRKQYRSLMEGIKTRLGREKAGWVDEFPNVLWAHRTSIKQSNGETLFSLTYESEVVIPAEIGMPSYEIRPAGFRPGEFVYRRNEASRVEDQGKLGPKWEGPYKVTEAFVIGLQVAKQWRTRMTNTQTPPTVVNTTGAPVANAVANHAEKPEKFNGQNFKRWQTVEPSTEGQSSNAQAVQAVEAWKHSDFLCHNYVLNGLIDPLYKCVCKTSTAKELWESLRTQYKTERCCVQRNSWIVKQKFRGLAYNCDNRSRAANCKMPKRVNPRQANMVDENVDMIAMVSDVCSMISEVNLRTTRGGTVGNMDRSCIMGNSATADYPRNLEIHQMDVKTAFLNGDLEEEIYMNQPECFIASGQEGKINAKKRRNGYVNRRRTYQGCLNRNRPVVIHCDSKIGHGRAKSTMYNGKSRHIRRRNKLDTDKLTLNWSISQLYYVASKDNIADPFTKGLSRELVSKSSKGMGLKPLKE
ncbi:reverse transcriptase domain-containing protein [Tanacetum coccineum]